MLYMNVSSFSRVSFFKAKYTTSLLCTSEVRHFGPMCQGMLVVMVYDARTVT
jgi:hypothetical protein